MSLALRIAAIGLWVALVVAMLNWSNTEAATAGVVAGTVALGAAVGRWWVLLAPVVPGLLLALGTLVSDPDDFYEGTPAEWALVVVVLTVLIAALLAIGVLLNRSASRLWARR
jgi:Mg2+/citrate symporter